MQDRDARTVELRALAVASLQAQERGAMQCAEVETRAACLLANGRATAQLHCAAQAAKHATTLADTQAQHQLEQQQAEAEWRGRVAALAQQLQAAQASAAAAAVEHASALQAKEQAVASMLQQGRALVAQHGEVKRALRAQVWNAACMWRLASCVMQPARS